MSATSNEDIVERLHTAARILRRDDRPHTASHVEAGIAALIAARAQIAELQRALREVRHDVSHMSGLRNEYQDFDSVIDCIDAALAESDAAAGGAAGEHRHTETDRGAHD